MTVRRSRLIPLLVISSLLFTSVVYACSGLRLMHMSFTSAPMDHATMERGPCTKHKQDICKSVRYEMLSVRPSSPLAEVTLHSLTILQAAHVEMPCLTNLLPTTGPPGVVFQPGPKSSFTLSKQVLRI